MIELKTYTSLAELGQEKWNSLGAIDYPFMRYEFLHALENSGSVGRKSGWQPLHIELTSEGKTALLMPCYLKYHSYGEYVFDWSWAQAYEDNGLNYYPKLLSAIPFTPASGPRWLTQLDESEAIETLTVGMQQLAHSQGIESWHLLFPPSASTTRLAQTNLLERSGIQYHWFNKNYSSFDHFLDAFNSRKRKDLRKERSRIEAQGIKFRRLNGQDVSQNELEIFYQFYAATYLKRGRAPYLNIDFFQAIFSSMPEQILLVFAEFEGRPIAGALSFMDSTTLYGRYWGCAEEYDALHFETCYYQGIEYCIEKGLKRFDPGAQGEHKIKRGFEPIKTYSYHAISSVPFNRAIQRFLVEEGRSIDAYIPELANRLPFKEQSD